MAFRLVILLSAILLQACNFAPVERAPGKPPDLVPVAWRGDDVKVVRGREIRIRFKDGVEEAVRERTVNEYGLLAERVFEYGRFIYYVNILNPRRVEGIVESLRLRAEVDMAEPNIPGTETGFVP